MSSRAVTYSIHHIAFREPGDASTGERLALPPFLEPRRTEIEANLRPIEPVAIASAPDAFRRQERS
ncbi:MAG: hypothetical protein M1396_06180 [Chloroflexi bacterium]|nr:hypothetical protein [Chloroflexota bacterium]